MDRQDTHTGNSRTRQPGLSSSRDEFDKMGFHEQLIGRAELSEYTDQAAFIMKSDRSSGQQPRKLLGQWFGTTRTLAIPGSIFGCQDCRGLGVTPGN